MGDKSNYAALEWVIGEIGETLNDARQALEAYVEDPRDTARIRFCLTHIHQVRGSLQMVEFHGASLFAEEMEGLANALMHGKVANDKEAQEVLMRSLLQLPHYLEQVKTYQDDHAGVVLPLLNDIRAVRKQGYLSETNLFNPDLSSVNDLIGERHSLLADTAKLRAVLTKLREMYQYAAAGVLRGVKIDENLAYIDKVLVRLEGMTRGTRAHPLWQTAAALVEALVRDDIELAVAVRGLLRQLARELKTLEDSCPRALDAPVAETLLRNLLFYVARAEDGGRRVAQVKQRFGLESALLGGGAERDKMQKGLISAPEPGAIRAVVVALQDELNTVKHLMNLALSGQGGLSDIEEMLPIVKRIGDTLAVLGIGDMRKLTMDQHELLKKMVAAGKTVDTDLIDVAGRLADIEHRLEAIAKGAAKHRDYASVDEREVEFDAAKEAVLNECRAGLDRVKDAIVEAMSAQWNPAQLPQASATLRDIEGGLAMLPLPRPAKILARCGKYIEEQLATSDDTPGEELQVLANAIASVDYYLERLAGTHGDELDTYLDIAEESLGQLGYGTGAGAFTDTAPAAEGPPAVSLPVDAKPGAWHDADAQAANEDWLADQQNPAPDATADRSAGHAEQHKQGNGTAVSAGEDGNEASAPPAGSRAHEPEQPLAPPSAAASGKQLPSEALGERSGDFDAEITDIFIEEAGEVLATLREYFPRWQGNLDDIEALTTVRRAFHTLKGSGRMVEALDVGELAWAIEAMLNQVMDATVPVHSAHARLIERVMAFLPALIDAFKNAAPNPDRQLWLTLEAQAKALSQREIPRELAGSGSFERVTLPAAADDDDLGAADLQVSGAEHTAPDLADDDEDEDQLLWEIFSSEAATHLAVVDGFVADMEQAAPLYAPPTDVLQSALHTLKGSAHMAGVKPIAAMIAPLEGFSKELRSYQVKVDKSILALLRDAASYTRAGLACIERREPVVVAEEASFVARVVEMHDRVLEPLIHAKDTVHAGLRVDPKLLSFFMSEGMAMLLDADEYLRQWRANPERLGADLAQMGAELATLERGAAEANLPHMQQLSELLGQVYEALASKSLAADEALLDLLAPAHETLLDMVDQVAAGQNIVPVSAELAAALAARLAEPAPSTREASAPLDPVAESFAVPISEEFSQGFSEEEIAQAHEQVAAGDSWRDEPGHLQDRAAEAEQQAGVPNEPTETAVAVAELANASVAAQTDTPFELNFGGDDGQPSVDYDLVIGEPEDDFFGGFGGQSDDGEGLEFTPFEPAALDLDTPPGDAWRLHEVDDIAAELTAVELSENASDDAATFDAAALMDDSAGTEVELASALTEPESVEPESFEPESFEPESFEPESFEPESVEAPFAEPEPDEMLLDDAEQGHDRAEAAVVEDATSGEMSLDREEEEWLFDDDDADQEATVEETAPVDKDETDNTEQPVAAFEDDNAYVNEAGVPAQVALAEQASAPARADSGAAGEHLPQVGIAALAAEATDVAAIDSDDFDADILEIFLDEANELIDELDEAIHSWESSWDDASAGEAMKRALHTLKGGARLSGLSRLGDLTHDYESFLIATRAPSEGFFQTIHQYQDTLLNAVKAVRARLDGEQPAAVDAPAVVLPAQAAPTDAPIEPPAQQDDATPVVSGEVVPFVADEAQAHELSAPQRALAESAAKRQGSQEMIKVSADLLEELVNLAGETSISRGRLEQQVSDLSSAVDEVDATLRRLNEQLRRLDIETEAQVLFRQERMAQHEQFDPLEMDRYSQLQQLTRSLMESSSDLVDLKSTISDKLRDTETLLLQQQRVNSSLQEGLMRSRMVPFSRLVPRLRRIVRQVSGELGKHVNFELDNVEGEMDRSVLERMVAPLEHMLRNAVDHGIESPQDRQAAGKPEMGRILLSLAREGGDILLRLADDGRGINLERVRKKAIERGLMTEEAPLSDHDVMQFILQAGFSTAEAVTQISGRGVGMDVVAAEIKQLGGSMTIDSKPGVGTQFVVRLPFTVSVNRALMVQLGAEVYAIPLNTIEGIVRVSPFELEHYFTHPDARFEYAGENYQVRYLGAMVTQELAPKLEGQLLPLPVILVRSGQLTMALQVDALSGSREIVVKSLGPQFAAVQGISGATVMGDGSVVVILDPHALVRKEMAQTGVNLAPLTPAAASKKLPQAVSRTIMVVDDSVTVRKVTSRFLEREGFHVITAKDGVDALQVLQESAPDLMLLDIEMPRMDGFEVARTMRSTQRWKQTPIIMITSRTGDKHRQHAFSIGVNEYLGKPYQEETLLKTINTLLAKHTAGA